MYPSMCQAVVPCGELLEALTTQTCDASEVVAQFQQSLSLENLSLEQPDPDTKKKVKTEVVEKWRKTISASTTGELKYTFTDH